MRVLFAVCFLLGTAIGVPAAPQAAPPRPNFAGHWVVDPAPDEKTSLPSFCFRDCVITHVRDTLTVKAGEQTRSYTLSGVPVVVEATNFGYTTTTTTTAGWVGNVLSITFKARAQGATADGPPNVTQLALQNGRLVIDNTRPSRGGDQLQTKTTYRRVP